MADRLLSLSLCQPKCAHIHNAWGQPSPDNLLGSTPPPPKRQHEDEDIADRGDWKTCGEEIDAPHGQPRWILPPERGEQRTAKQRQHREEILVQDWKRNLRLVDLLKRKLPQRVTSLLGGAGGGRAPAIPAVVVSPPGSTQTDGGDSSVPQFLNVVHHRQEGNQSRRTKRECEPADHATVAGAAFLLGPPAAAHAVSAKTPTV